MKPKAALVLSGGGSMGMAHVGALSVLEDVYDFEYFAGVSAGALCAAGAATGMKAQEIADTVYAQNFFSLTFDFSDQTNALLRGEKIHALFRDIFGDRRIESLEPEKKLRIGATDFSTGAAVTLSRGTIADALRGSVSIPVLFEPFVMDDPHPGDTQIALVDGGLSQNLPLPAAQQEYPGTIIAVDVASLFPYRESRSDWNKMTSIQKNVERSIRIFFHNQIDPSNIESRVHILRPELDDFCTSLRKSTLREMEAIGRQCAQEFVTTQSS